MEREILCAINRIESSTHEIMTYDGKEIQSIERLGLTIPCKDLKYSEVVIVESENIKVGFTADSSNCSPRHANVAQMARGSTPNDSFQICSIRFN